MNLEDYGFIFGSQNKILLWHLEMVSPTRLVKDKEGDVTSFVFDENTKTLYNARKNGKVEETISGKVLTEVKSDLPDTKAPIMGLTSIDGKVLAIYEPKPQEETKIFNVNNESESWVIPIDYDKKGIDMRCIVSFINDGKSLYVSSENVVKLDIEGKKIKETRLTDCIADFVYLVFNGKNVFSVHYHNPDSHPKGTEIWTLPENKKVAYFTKVNKKTYNGPGMITMVEDHLIIGRPNPYPNKGNLYAIKITDRIIKSDKMSRAKSILLLENAFEKPSYEHGNPIIAILRKELNEIIKNIK